MAAIVVVWLLVAKNVVVVVVAAIGAKGRHTKTTRSFIEHCLAYQVAWQWLGDDEPTIAPIVTRADCLSVCLSVWQDRCQRSCHTDTRTDRRTDAHSYT